MTPDETSAETLWRVKTLEAQVVKLETHLSEGLVGLHTRIGSLTFVSRELYESERAAMRREVDGARRVAMWALGMVCALVLGAIVTAIAAVARG